MSKGKVRIIEWRKFELPDQSYYIEIADPKCCEPLSRTERYKLRLVYLAEELARAFHKLKIKFYFFLIRILDNLIKRLDK